MKKTFLLTLVLILGLISSQIVPSVVGPIPESLDSVRHFLTMALLSFIMIGVGREFEIDLKRKKQYAVDYGIAATAAAFPWIFVTIYFVVFLLPETTSSGRSAWIEALLAGRFAAPTSAGVLFSMLAAAGLAGTWTYKKTRILAIFDDLDTVLLMIPLKILMVGLAWQLGGVVVALTVLIYFGLRSYRRLTWPTSWPWLLGYSLVITAVSEFIYSISKDPATNVGLHIEVLLPAFILGCALRGHSHEAAVQEGGLAHENHSEERVGLVISSAFLFLVGFSMPYAFGDQSKLSMEMAPWTLAGHVLAVTLVSNLGKMFPVFCYRSEASLKERFAVAVSMFPRGEVGAGVLAVSLDYGIAGPFVTVAFLSLALNLVLTGGFIWGVKKLLNSPTAARSLRETAPQNG